MFIYVCALLKKNEITETMKVWIKSLCITKINIYDKKSHLYFICDSVRNAKLSVP
jgi:hypothetical protein